MRSLILAALVAVVPVSLPAQDAGAGLREMLAALPDPAGLERTVIFYGDPELARGLDLSGVDGASAEPAVRATRGLPPGPLGMALMPRRGRATTAAGFGLGEIERMLTLSAIPHMATILDLAPGVGARVAPALAAMGYAEASERGVTAWALGTEGRGGRRAERSGDDPFRTLARLPRVVVDGDRLRHGEGWDMIFALERGVGRSILARPEIAALAGVPDRMPGAGALVQAALYPAMDLLRPAAPADLVPGLPRDAVWQALVLADMTDGAQSTGLVALAVGPLDADGAGALTDRMARAWDEARTRGRTPRTLAEITGGPVTAATHPAGEGLWIVTLHQTRPTVVARGGHTHNPTYDALMALASRAPLPILTP